MGTLKVIIHREGGEGVPLPFFTVTGEENISLVFWLIVSQIQLEIRDFEGLKHTIRGDSNNEF
jgi:hypothetical protein